jgi:hypothetical protein
MRGGLDAGAEQHEPGGVRVREVPGRQPAVRASSQNRSDPGRVTMLA